MARKFFDADETEIRHDRKRDKQSTREIRRNERKLKLFNREQHMFETEE